MQRHFVRLVLVALLSLLANFAVAEVVLAVSKETPVSSIKRDRLADIYLGRATQLPDGTNLTPLDQSESSPAYPEFYRQYLGRAPAQIKSHWSRLIFTGRGQPPRSVGGNEAMAKAIASTPETIGYLDSKYLTDSLRVVSVE